MQAAVVTAYGPPDIVRVVQIKRPEPKPGDASRVRPDGVLLPATADLWQTLRSRGPVKTGIGPERADDSTHLLGLVAHGGLRVVIDQVIDLQDISRAYERIDSGHKVGAFLVRP